MRLLGACQASKFGVTRGQEGEKGASWLRECTSSPGETTSHVGARLCAACSGAQEATRVAGGVGEGLVGDDSGGGAALDRRKVVDCLLEF